MICESTDNISLNTNEETRLQDFIVILKRMLQNYYKILKTCILVTSILVIGSWRNIELKRNLKFWWNEMEKVQLKSFTLNILKIHSRISRKYERKMSSYFKKLFFKTQVESILKQALENRFRNLETYTLSKWEPQ